MDVMYHGVRLTLGNKLFFAPIKAPTAVLDVGTGTGEVYGREHRDPELR